MTGEVRAAALRMYQAFNSHDHAAALEIFTDDFYSHPLEAAGPQSVVEAWQRFHDAFPEARVEVEDIIVDGDSVATRLSVHGIPDQTPTMLEMYRVRDGRIAELWALTSMRRDA
ncbi:ester cyclase [Actinoplanes sp. NPDC020271]|uniref:ester cyclase n=1 Tax=Actinoplanes sp. NPDC020271 TaxID=3363896 RepID=UPI0037B89DFE